MLHSFVAALLVAVSLVVPEPRPACEHVVAVVARGSGDENAGPTSFSNGWEGPAFQEMFRRLEARHPGILEEVKIIGLPPEVHPARLPDYEIPENPSETGMAIPTVSDLEQAATSFFSSVWEGRKNFLPALEKVEKDLGCRPKYIVVGYSQGTMVTSPFLRELERREQLVGVLDIGNPYTKASDPATVGNAGTIGGILRHAPNWSDKSPRINYCLPRDPVCDIAPGTIAGAFHQGGKHGDYFLEPHQWDDEVLDELASWIRKE